MSIDVRPARREELDRVNALRRQVNELHCAGRPDIFRPGFGEALQRYVYAQFDGENSAVIVACVGDEIAGFAAVQYVSRPMSPFSLPRAYYRVEEFCVDERFRRMGVGSALVEYMKRDARERGFDRIELDVWSFNESALRFYERVGFTDYRRYMELPLDAEASEEK